jgi:Zn-dependent protease
MFSNGLLNQFFSDPRAALMMFLLALPGRMLAISAHEAAHGWMADRCGDPTARLMGRITLNPIRHLDPVGLFCMMVFGIGWAKPVPVNPRNFRGNYRKCDLLVSIAGVSMNLLMFLIGCVAMYVFIAAALAAVPYELVYTGMNDVVRTVYEGVPALISGEYWIGMEELMGYGVSLSDFLIVPVFGRTAGYVYEMLSYFVITNLVLAVFNLIPLPPLDGYHVLNDLVLKGRLYASGKAARIGQSLLYLGLFTGVLSDVLGAVYDFVLGGVGQVATAIFRAFGVF